MYNEVLIFNLGGFNGDLGDSFTQNLTILNQSILDYVLKFRIGFAIFYPFDSNCTIFPFP